MALLESSNHASVHDFHDPEGVEGTCDHSPTRNLPDDEPELAPEAVLTISRARSVEWVGTGLSDALSIVAVVDGTEADLMGLEYVVKRCVMRGQEAKLFVVHDAADDALPENGNADGVRSRCEALVASACGEARHIGFLSVSGGELSIAQSLLEVRRAHAAQFVTVGRSRLASGLSQAGSIMAEILRDGNCSILVTNTDDPEYLRVRRPSKFAVTASMNPATAQALVDAIRLSLPGDEIHIVYIKSFLEGEDSDYTRHVCQKYHALFDGFESTERQGQVLKHFCQRLIYFTLVEKRLRESTVQAFLQHAEEEVGADFVCVGANTTRADRGKQPLGAVSASMCCETRLSCIVSAYTPTPRPAFLGFPSGTPPVTAAEPEVFSDGGTPSPDAINRSVEYMTGYLCGWRQFHPQAHDDAGAKGMALL